MRSDPIRVAIDLETTGLRPDQDAIIEMGADVQSCHLKHSLVGERAHISGLNGALVIGDDASVWADSGG